ncbi:MAG: hypothetical protein ACYTGZ_22050 [Planctomycetota bacterium]
MGKSGATILGIAVLAGAAIYIGSRYLSPGAEHAERKEAVLTGALEPQVEAVEFLEDSDLPPGVTPPKVGEPMRYVRLTIFYPQRPKVPTPSDHHLTQVNAESDFEKVPVHVEEELVEEGARLFVTYRVSADFVWGRIECNEKLIVARFELD